MQQPINKIVREFLIEQAIIQENFATNKELEHLTDDILTHWGRIWLSNKELDIYFDVSAKESVDLSNYKILYDFLRETYISIEFSEKINARGQFQDSPGSFKYYKITLRLNERSKKNIERVIDDFEGGNENDMKTSIYFATNEFTSTLLHELQHAYDCWRSEGNFANHQRKDSYQAGQRRTEKIQSKPKITRPEYEQLANQQRQYLRLPHEVNARFTQAIADIRIFELDDDFRKVLKKWEDYYYDFRTTFMGYAEMSNGIKKNLVRRLAKVYQDAADDYVNIQNQAK